MSRKARARKQANLAAEAAKTHKEKAAAEDKAQWANLGERLKKDPRAKAEAKAALELMGTHHDRRPS
jgi:hypothetical protein